MFVICLLGIGLYAKVAFAASIIYGEKSWTVTPIVSTQFQASNVNGADIAGASRHILLGKSLESPVKIFDPQTLASLQAITEEVTQPVVNAQLEIKDGWATTFIPDQNGLAIDLNWLAQMFGSEGVAGINLPVLVSEPSVKLAELNDMGINELVARGESDFSGSTKNRIVNVTVGSGKYNGLILKPGEEFSFNKFLGEVDAEHGFKPELVIKATGVTPEFGGGLCQVSSTMFRAAMNAGFPITARRNHSFAVHYYFPQGTDATIYPGVQDMKYINNLKTPVLIHTHMDLAHTKLYFDIYGTKDDRVVTFEGPVQYDRQTNGALKATWTRHVTLNGETTTQTFNSTYQPPALFQKQQTTVASTPNPQAESTPANSSTTPTPDTTKAQPTT
ncbi:MAG: VanW family protein [Candidatus Doudnabacteria bacterium]|nr:VanW family protein [Candidatus Doudnabacteria bacterium]